MKRKGSLKGVTFFIIYGQSC